MIALSPPHRRLKALAPLSKAAPLEAHRIWLQPALPEVSLRSFENPRLSVAMLFVRRAVDIKRERKVDKTTLSLTAKHMIHL